MVRTSSVLTSIAFAGILSSLSGCGSAEKKTVKVAARVEQPALAARPDWEVMSEAGPEETHEVTFVVQQKNLDQLQAALMSVSDPESPNRGLYLSNSDVNALTTDKKAVSKVESFLTEAGVEFERVDSYGNYIKAVTTVTKLESMFKTDIKKVKAVHHVRQGGHHVPLLRAVTPVTLPEEISDHVAGVFRLSSLPPVMVQKPELPALGNATMHSTASTVTPAGLRSYYNVPETATGSSSQSQCVFESLGQYTSPSDLASFESKFKLPQKDIAENIGNHLNDEQCKANPNNCGEANLDVQYMIAMAPDTPLTNWYVEESNTVFEDWIEQVAKSSNPPLVNSISYGGIEESVPKSVTSAFDTEAMKLGAQGVTVFVSSGDDGVANFQARSDKQSCGYHPSFPATSPYVTAVGATQGGINGGSEVACSSDTGGQITTGGGFSTKYDMPSYQADAVKDYLASSAGKDAASGYASGRGYPDIAMAGYNYEVVIAGRTIPVSGTSASSPVVAGFASLVNAKLAAADSSMKSVGFINPTLYKAGTSSFNDITSGNNKCCAEAQVCCSEGFEATSGWDPLTGLGSVDYKKFEALFMNDDADEDEDDPTEAPETTQAPVEPTTTGPVAPTPSPERCHACLTVCDPCRECTEGPEGSFAFGSCEKCWHCWDWDDDELEDSDKDMDKDCDALHKDHDWDDDEVRCLTDANTKAGMDCRACWNEETTTEAPATTTEPEEDEETTETMLPVNPTTFAPETTESPVNPTTFAPETTKSPVNPTTFAPETTETPVDPTEAPVDPTEAPLTLKQCRGCFSICAPCQECAEGSNATFLWGSCDKCWSCWNWGKDKLKDDDDDMSKHCDVMHQSHDWDDDKVRCLTDSPKSSKVSSDCRPCWDTFGNVMLGEELTV